MVLVMGKDHQKKDNTGKRFGNMIVLYDSGLRQNRKVVWTCQCDCGNIFNTRSDHINSGKTVSCPECAKKKNIKNLLEKTNKDFISLKPGDQYEHLTIIQRTEHKNSNGCWFWLCQCDCGKTTEIDTAHWGKTASCGHIKGFNSIDLTNQRFGKLIALKQDGKYEKNGSYYWLCKCDCGRTTKVLTTLLTGGHTQSCGLCLRSKGELKIEDILKENNIIFETQKTFQNCKFPNTNYSARYDFYLPDYNLLIEYDGEQHFQYNSSNNQFWNTEEEYKKCQYRDNYKNQWAKENNIKLKRIPYYDYDKIDLNYLLS